MDREEASSRNECMGGKEGIAEEESMTRQREGGQRER